MCEGGSETGELLLSSVANALRQRGLELYVIINKATWLQSFRVPTGFELPTAVLQCPAFVVRHYIITRNPRGPKLIVHAPCRLIRAACRLFT